MKFNFKKLFQQNLGNLMVGIAAGAMMGGVAAYVLQNFLGTLGIYTGLWTVVVFLIPVIVVIAIMRALG